MGKICWDFPLLGTGNESGNNIAAITMFKGSGVMDGLAREICQNSLDAKDSSLPSDNPVKVKFELMDVKKSDYPVFKSYEEAVESSIEYWNNSPLCTPSITEFLSNIKTALDSETIPMLVMSDYNTVGLNGVNASPHEQSFWNLLVNTEGISIKQNDNSAGSFGIGKNAPFAYSALNLVFYNTLAKDGGRAFEGVTRLVTTQREYNGTMRPTQPIGKYLYLIDDYTGRPILPSDDCPIAQMGVFNRTEIGTDVAVVGFKKSDYTDWERLTAVAIIKNFVLAIINGQLTVTVKSPKIEYVIDSERLERLLFIEFGDEPQLKYTRQTYETIANGELIKTKIAEKDDLSIYVKYDEKYSASLSRFRSTGMLINTTTNDVLPHFSVVIIVNDVGEMRLSKTMRSAEPPQHTEWRAKNITDNLTLKNRAGRYIRKIGKEIQSVLDDFDRADITDKMDAGIGNYLPDATDSSGATEGSDGLKTDVKIKEIKSYDGQVFYNSQYESAESSTGSETQKTGVKTGKKKRKKRLKNKIPVVTPGGKSTGVSTGKGKVKIVSPKIVEHRTFYLAGNKYRCFINSPDDYEKVFIQYFAGRDDDKQDSLVVKNLKLEGSPCIEINSEKIGPISLKKGVNTMYVEFSNNEIMAVVPVFTMEVSDEKQSN